MRNYLQNQINEMYKSILILLMLLLAGISVNAQCNTKITDPDQNGKDYVCAGSTTQYQAVRDLSSTGDTLSWSLSSGGTIISANDNGTTSTV
ncbi:MAG TPA: hypothetical protein ENI82_06650, partial [Bacteroidetes bacterium]|nr:hypothetical protein [Bacteroidota bacterium]